MFDDSCLDLVKKNWTQIMQVSKQKDEWDLYAKLFKIYQFSALVKQGWQYYCDTKDYDTVQMILEEGYYQDTWLINDVIYYDDIYLQCMVLQFMSNSQQLLDKALEYAHYEYEKHKSYESRSIVRADIHKAPHAFIFIEKLLKMGANVHVLTEHCATNYFERASHLELAKLYIENGIQVDIQKLKIQMLYAIVCQYGDDSSQRWNNDSITQYYDRPHFMLSTIQYQSSWVRAYEEESIVVTCDACKRCDSWDDVWDDIKEFLEELGIEYVEYDTTVAEDLMIVKKFMSSIDMDYDKLEETIKEHYPEFVGRQKFLYFEHTFPPQTFTNTGQGDNMPPGCFNYWCFEDHLDESFDILFKKYKLVRDMTSKS